MNAIKAFVNIEDTDAQWCCCKQSIDRTLSVQKDWKAEKVVVKMTVESEQDIESVWRKTDIMFIIEWCQASETEKAVKYLTL